MWIFRSYKEILYAGKKMTQLKKKTLGNVTQIEERENQKQQHF